MDQLECSPRVELQVHDEIAQWSNRQELTMSRAVDFPSVKGSKMLKPMVVSRIRTIKAA